MDNSVSTSQSWSCVQPGSVEDAATDDQPAVAEAASELTAADQPKAQTWWSVEKDCSSGIASVPGSSVPEAASSNGTSFINLSKDGPPGPASVPGSSVPESSPSALPGYVLFVPSESAASGVPRLLLSWVRCFQAENFNV